MSDASVWKPGSDVPLVTNEVNVFQAFVATAAQTVFTLTDYVYVINSDAMRVTVNGVMQVPGRDFTETSSTVVTLAFAADADDDVVLWGVANAEYSTAATLAAASAAAAAASAAEAAGYATDLSNGTIAFTTPALGNATATSLTISGGTFTSRGITDAATATVISLSGAGANHVTIANSGSTPTIGTSSGHLSILPAASAYVGIGVTPVDSTGCSLQLQQYSSVLAGAYSSNLVYYSGAWRGPRNSAWGGFLIGPDATNTVFVVSPPNAGAAGAVVTTLTAMSIVNATGVVHLGAGTNMVTVAGSATNPTIGTSAGDLMLSAATYKALQITGVAGAVNYAAIAGSASTHPHISSNSGGVFLGGAQANPEVLVGFSGGATRYITLTGSNGGNPTIGTSAGNLALAPAGGGSVILASGTNTGYELSDGTIAGVMRTASTILAIGTTTDHTVAMYAGGAIQAVFTSIPTATRYVSFTGSAAGNPTIGTSAGSLVISTTLSVSGNLFSAGYGQLHSDDATPAGGATNTGLFFGSAAVGIYFGSGAPTVAAARGSLYIRTDNGANTSLYVNRDGSTTWAAVTSA